jgi:DNA-binding NtrC family response regulator
MPESTALLITRDSSLVGAVREALGAVSNLSLRIAEPAERAAPELQRHDVVLLLVHLTRDGSAAAVEQQLKFAAARRSPVPVIVLSDQNHPEQALALLQQGAADYLERPLDLRRLAYRADTLTARSRLVGPRAAPAAAVAPSAQTEEPEMEGLMELVRRVAPQETTVLLVGETGTGKTRLARQIHELSPRRAAPLLVIDCGSLSPSLIESEMFGHVRGAFTGADRNRPGKFAAAAGGTLLLDEINSLPLALQSKLLRAVDERVFEPVGSNSPQPLKARLIAATNTPLEREVEKGRFRADLYYRLNVVGFYLQPLRERLGMIEGLVAQFLAEFAQRNRRDVRGLSPAALGALLEHSWPGNVRELRNEIERAVALCPGPEIQLEDLSDPVRTAAVRTLASPESPGLVCAPPPAAPATGTLAQFKERAEARHITEVLRRHNNNRQRAAAELGISRMTLYQKLHRYGLIGGAPGRDRGSRCG